MPETLSLHIPVALRGMDKGTLRPLTLHVPYNGCEYCRSQLGALLQLQTDPHRKEGECASMLRAINPFFMVLM